MYILYIGILSSVNLVIITEFNSDSGVTIFIFRNKFVDSETICPNSISFKTSHPSFLKTQIVIPLFNIHKFKIKTEKKNKTKKSAKKCESVDWTKGHLYKQGR